MFNTYSKNGLLQNKLKSELLSKPKVGTRSLSALAIALAITMSSCSAIASDAHNDTTNNKQTSSDVTLEEIRVVAEKHSSISESGSRLGLSLKEIPATIDIIDGDAIQIRSDYSVLNTVTRSAGFTGFGNPGNGGTNISARGFTGQDAVTKLYDGNRLFTLAGNKLKF